MNVGNTCVSVSCLKMRRDEAEKERLCRVVMELAQEVKAPSQDAVWVLVGKVNDL